MRKTNLNESVVHQWLSELPFQMQALLMTAMRGPDGSNKHNSAKAIVRYLRGVVLRPAGKLKYFGVDGSFENDNDFMWGEYQLFPVWIKNFWEDHDGYPHHFIMHLFHCAEVIGYTYPHTGIALLWQQFYYTGCHQFHLTAETKEEMFERLNDFGNVISTERGSTMDAGREVPGSDKGELQSNSEIQQGDTGHGDRDHPDYKGDLGSSRGKHTDQWESLDDNK